MVALRLALCGDHGSYPKDLLHRPRILPVSGAAMKYEHEINLACFQYWSHWRSEYFDISLTCFHVPLWKCKMSSTNSVYVLGGK